MPNRYYPRAGVILDVLLQGETERRTLELRPRRVEIERNDHRTADTFTVELDYRDFPLDPRGIVSARIRILLGDLGTNQVAELADTERNIAFVGFVDVPETSLDESGEVVKLEGRDYTGVFLDHRWVGSSIRIDQRLVSIIQDIRRQVPGVSPDDEGGIHVGFIDDTDSIVPSTVIGKTIFTPQKNDDAWTVLCDLCGRLGLIPVFALDYLLVLAPADIGAGREDFSFGTGSTRQRQMTVKYGENLKRLTFRRNFVEAKSKQVQVTCWNAQTRQVLVGLYPSAPITVKRRVTASGKVENDVAPILPFYISGTFTQADVTAKARRIYEEAARDEVEGEFETSEMLVTNADGTTFDVPRLGNGDRLELRLGTSLISTIASMFPEEAVAYLTSPPRNMDETVAQALVAAYGTAQGVRTFYIKSARHTWSRDDGYKLTAEFANLAPGVT